jgi:hypothetical protein
VSILSVLPGGNLAFAGCFPGGYQVLNNFERGEHVTQVLKGDFLQ